MAIPGQQFCAHTIGWKQSPWIIIESERPLWLRGCCLHPSDHPEGAGPPLSSHFNKSCRPSLKQQWRERPWTGMVTNSILFCWLFVKTHWFAWRQINDPSSRKHYSLPFLPATPSSPSRALLPELQRYKDTVGFGALGVEVPEHQPKTSDANLDWAFVEKALFYTKLWLWKVNII